MLKKFLLQNTVRAVKDGILDIIGIMPNESVTMQWWKET